MKLFALLLAVGFAAGTSQLGLRGDKEYVFSYEGRLLTGIPELNQRHFSGLGVRAQVQVQVSQDGYYRVSVTDAKFAKANEELQSQTSDQESINWRNVKLPEFSAVPSQAAEDLKKPMTFKLSTTDGRFESLKVSQDEPQWSVNFKKALVVLFQTKTVQSLEATQSNMIRDERNSQTNFWITQEESLDGFCDVTYQINELPEYIIRENPQLMPRDKQCPQDQKTYEIVRSRDLSTCTRRSIFSFYKPGHYRCNSAADCEGQWSKSSVTRYIACGPRHELKVQTIINEGEMQRAVSEGKIEKVLTGARQVLYLQETRSMQQSQQQQLEEPRDAVTYKSLVYEHQPAKKHQQHGQQTAQEQIKRIKSQKQSQVQAGQMTDQDLRQELKEQIKKTVQEIVDQDLETIEDLPKKQVPLKAISLAGAFSMLSKDDIRSVYDELKSQYSGDEEKLYTFKNIFYDTVIMGGTYNNLRFVKEMIDQGEISRYQIASIFVFLPSYILTPTSEVFDTLLELVRSPKVTEEPLVFNQAILSYAQLMHNACLAPNRNTSYPAQVYGQFCSPDSMVVQGKFLPFLFQELNRADSVERRSAIIVAFGTLGHRGAIPTLLPFIDGSYRQASGKQVTKNERFLALYALTKIGRLNPLSEIVEPILFSILNNQAEHTEFRVAAFNSLLSLNPKTNYLHRVAALTWRDNNKQVLEAINTAFFSLAEAREAEPLQNRLTSLPRKAWLIYPLIKKTGKVFPHSLTLIQSDYMDTLGLGYKNTVNYHYGKGENSYLPTSFYTRMVNLMNRYEYSAFETGYRLTGQENLIQQLVEILSPGQSHVSKEQFARKVQENLSSEWKKVIEQLKIKPVSDEDNDEVEGSVFLRMFEKAPIFHSLSSENSRELKEKIQRTMLGGKSLKESICGEHKINIQKLMNYMPSEASMPSELGFPIIVETHAPTLFSLKGRINVECNNNRGLIPSLKVNLRKMVADHKISYIGTVLPFTNEYLLTGLDEHKVINTPMQIEGEYNAEEHQLKIKAKALTGISRPIDVIHYQVRPFTVAQKITDLRPMTLNSRLHQIKSKTEAKNFDQTFGGDLLGLKMGVSLKTESHHTDVRAVFDKLRFFNYNPINLFRFPFTPAAISEQKRPSLRLHEFKLWYNPAESSTKEIDINLKWGVASKVEGEQVKYHQVKRIENSEEMSSFPQWKKVLPLKIVSKPIGESGEQRQRQQKIKQVMEKIRVEQGTGVHVDFDVTFVGGRPQTYSYGLTVGSGVQSLKQKWDMKLQRSNSDYQICMKGEMELPSVPRFDIDELRSSSNLNFRYENVLGYGRECQESQIKIRGDGKVSERQKEWSKKSPAAKQLEQLKQKRSPLIELSKSAEEVRRQASTFDESNISVEYVNVGGYTVRVSEYLREAVKALLYPYVIESSQRNQVDPRNTKNEWNVRFYPESNTVDIRQKQQNGEEVLFKNVRLPRAVQFFYPDNAIDQTRRFLTGPIASDKVYPTCKVEGKYINTFSNKTMKNNMDECFHLLAADSSYEKKFAILERKVSQGENGLKELKVLIGKHVIKFQSSASQSHGSGSGLKVTVDDQEIDLPKDQIKSIKDKHGNEIAQIQKSKDEVITMWIRSKGVPTVVITFDGLRTKVSASSVAYKSLTGMCGDLYGPRSHSSVGPDECVYSKPELIAAANRMECSKAQLPQEVRSKYQQEKSRCTKARTMRTKLTDSINGQHEQRQQQYQQQQWRQQQQRDQRRQQQQSGSQQLQQGDYQQQQGTYQQRFQQQQQQQQLRFGGDSNNACSKYQHQVLDRPSKVCFSRKPVLECDEWQCRASEIVHKSVSFACLPQGRIADRYKEKARRGEVIDELANLPEDLSFTMSLPRTCVRA